MKKSDPQKKEEGVAVAPVLFVVAILGILAAAIAASSGSFSGSAQREDAKTKAATLIEIGQNLKFGWDRITSNGIDPANVVIDPTSTSGVTDLFSPSGGGIAPPSTTIGTSQWCYFNYSPNGAAAVIMIPHGSNNEICREVNRMSLGQPVAPGAPFGINMGNCTSTSNFLPDMFVGGSMVDAGNVLILKKDFTNLCFGAYGAIFFLQFLQLPP